MISLQNNNQRTLPISQYDLNYRSSQIQGQCTLLAVQSLTRSIIKTILVIILSICTLGLPLLFTQWWPRIKRLFFYSYCQLDGASHFLVENYDNEISIVCKQQATFFDGEEQKTYFYFTNRYLNYLILEDTVKAISYQCKQRIKKSMIAVQGQARRGWSTGQAHKLQQSFGPGAMVITQPSACDIFTKQILRPLYIFLFLNIVIQLEVQYYYYCILITISVIIGVAFTIHEVKQVNAQIHEMSFYQVPLSVLRDGEIRQVSSLKVVPGDIIFLKDPIRLPFDAVLLEGEMLINECVLTGQSVPVVKKAEEVTNGEIGRSSTAYEGSTIVQINWKKRITVWQQYRQNYGLPVCVTRTNFATAKGQLIRKILYPSQIQNKFQQQSYKFLFFLFFLTVVSYAVLIMHLHNYITPITFVKRGFDLVTITVPPTLPIAMTIGIIYALQKLKAKEIYTISPNQIVEGGVLDTMCFDKTGTLTSDSMDFKTLLLAHERQFDRPLEVATQAKPQSPPEYFSMALANMACNHTVVKLQSTGKLVGDPMEIQLLDYSECQLQGQVSDLEVLFAFRSKRLKGEVLKRYDFDSSLQRMSVICRLNTGKTYIFSKGSPQIMLSIMNMDSVPKEYSPRLRQYASSGFRILTIASKQLQTNWKESSREELEFGLQFNGFEVFENSLKPQTYAAIEELRRVDITTIMITGDNPITASNIGYQSGILDPHTKTLIIDTVGQQFHEQEFIYSFQDLPLQSSSRDQFYRQSQRGVNLNTEELRYADQLLERVQKNNYNICLTGKAFHRIFSQSLKDTDQLHPVLKDMLEATQIYARTKPDDKSNVVSMYQKIGLAVGFCGDGANDCAALSKANLGLSLSQTEASIAAAFTAKRRHIGSMVELIKQSRAGLATNFSLFNIMACYALTQYASSIIDQFYFSYPADFQFIYQDIILNMSFVFLLGNIPTAQTLTKQRPSNTLFSLANLTQLILFHMIQLASQILAVFAAGGPFADTLNYYAIAGVKVNYQRYVAKGRGGFLYDSTENNTTFLVGNFFLLGSIMGFMITRPWKKQFWTYWPFTLLFFATLIYTSLIVLFPPARLSVFNLTKINSTSFTHFLFGIGMGVGVFLIIFMQKFVLVPLFRWLEELGQERKKQRRRSRYLK